MGTGAEQHAHPVARVLVWVFGLLAGLTTVWLVFLLIVVASEWSSYVGHESSTAMAIVGFAGAAPTVLAWLVFLIPWSISRS